MKKLVILAGLLLCGLLAAGPATAAPTTTLPTTLQDLINDSGPGAGFQIQDKIFNNFVYTPTDTVNDPASQVKVSVIFSPSSTGNDQHGFSFSQNGLWASGFTLSYSVAVDTTLGPNTKIIASLDQILDGLVGSTLPSAIDTQSVGTLTLNNAGGLNTAQIGPYPGVTSLTTRSVVIVGSNGLQSWEQDWFEVNGVSVPEPSMLLLLGTGLVGVAGFRRKFKK